MFTIKCGANVHTCNYSDTVAAHCRNLGETWCLLIEYCILPWWPGLRLSLEYFPPGTVASATTRPVLWQLTPSSLGQAQ